MTTPPGTFDELSPRIETDASRIRVALARIAEKLAALRRADTECEVRGADHHLYLYRLNPPLSERMVVAFEKRVRVRVPEEYRAFVLEIANGGAGPDDGIDRLGYYQGDETLFSRGTSNGSMSG